MNTAVNQATQAARVATSNPVIPKQEKGPARVLFLRLMYAIVHTLPGDASILFGISNNLIRESLVGRIPMEMKFSAALL